MSITLIAIIAVALLIVRFAKRFFSKLIGVVLISAVIVGYMYKSSIGPFKKNVADISQLEEKYCQPEGDIDICDCILKPALQDMKNRFTVAEIDSLTVQKIKAAYILHKSLQATKEQALICLATTGTTEKYKIFLQDLIPIENSYLDSLEKKARDLGDKIKKEMSLFQDNKEDIDSKY
jgi:hypothetical protein